MHQHQPRSTRERGRRNFFSALTSVGSARQTSSPGEPRPNQARLPHLVEPTGPIRYRLHKVGMRIHPLSLTGAPQQMSSGHDACHVS